MTAWGFVGITLIVLAFFATLYLVVEFIGRAAERRYRTAAQEALDRYWKQHKDELRHDIPCPNCHLHFDAPDQTYFECPHCAFLLTTEWVKNYHHRKMKEEWENSFSGRFYRIAPESQQKR
ncbi:MAG: hypothetical protein R2834_09585 [Rhodothermales bacterium]